MRGAYTAGALCWLIDNNIEFDGAYGISTGAVHLCNYLLKNKKNLFDFSTKYINNKDAIGVKAFFRCGHIVDYEFLFDNLMVKRVKFDTNDLKDVKTNAKIGVYEFKSGKTEYHPVQNIDVQEIKAACTLPLLGKVAKLGDRKMFDGGITDMIPIEQSLADGFNRHIIITTKPENYVRKPSNKFVVWLMKLVYRDCKSIGNDYEIRHMNYYKQISKINDLVNDKEAIYIYPSKSSNVSRLGGSQAELEELFELGRSDMEAKKEEIFKLLQIKKKP